MTTIKFIISGTGNEDVLPAFQCSLFLKLLEGKGKVLW